MIVYVESVMVVNMVINSLILLLTKDILKAKIKRSRLLLSSLLGTIVAIFSPMFSNIINLLIKLPLAMLMIMIAFAPKTIKKALATLLVFMLVTFAFGGALLGVCEIFGIKFFLSKTVEYEYDFPIGFVLLVCYVTYLSAKNILKYIFKKHSNNFLFDVVLKNKQKQLDCIAFLDSGNKISQNGQPISLINFKTFNALFPEISLTNILLKHNLPLCNIIYIDIKSIGSETKSILTFEIECLTIKHNTNNFRTIKNARLGLSLVDFSKNTDSDIIISNQILGDNYELEIDKKIS